MTDKQQNYQACELYKDSSTYLANTVIEETSITQGLCVTKVIPHKLTASNFPWQEQNMFGSKSV